MSQNAINQSFVEEHTKRMKPWATIINSAGSSTTPLLSIGTEMTKITTTGRGDGGDDEQEHRGGGRMVVNSRGADSFDEQRMAPVEKSKSTPPSSAKSLNMNKCATIKELALKAFDNLWHYRSLFRRGFRGLQGRIISIGVVRSKSSSK
jgi:hypothetical protein